MPSTIHAVNTNLMLWAGIGIIGIGTIGYLLSQYAKIKTVSKLAFNRRRRTRRRR
jgi:lactate dehydrogenase-like 2-hydroxyacid dehydrogenase